MIQKFEHINILIKFLKTVKKVVANPKVLQMIQKEILKALLLCLRFTESITDALANNDFTL